MSAQIGLGLDSDVAGETRVFGSEALAADSVLGWLGTSRPPMSLLRPHALRRVIALNASPRARAWVVA